MNKLTLPFTNDMKGGSRKSFKILNEQQINKKIKKSESLINFVKKMVFMNNSQNNTNKVNFVKASSTKTYYKNMKK
jgi:hypothetical protein